MTIVHYQFSRHEAARGFVKVRRWNNRLEIILPAVLSASVAFVGVARHVHHAKGSPEEIFLFGGVAGLVTLLLVVLASRWYVRWFIARFVHKNAELFTSPTDLSFDGNRLIFSAISMKQEFAWTVFKGLRQDLTHFYLFSGTGGVSAVIPKRAFDGASLAEFLRCSQLSPLT